MLYMVSIYIDIQCCMITLKSYSGFEDCYLKFWFLESISLQYVWWIQNILLNWCRTTQSQESKIYFISYTEFIEMTFNFVIFEWLCVIDFTLNNKPYYHWMIEMKMSFLILFQCMQIGFYSFTPNLLLSSLK